MTQMTIYMSVNCDGDSLTLDGNLYLLKELLRTLCYAGKNQASAIPIPALLSDDPQQSEGEDNANP